MLPLVLSLALSAGATVSIQVEVVGASDQGPAEAGGSQPVGHLERDLRTTLKFKHYRELAQQTLSVALADTTEMALPNGARLRLTPLALDAEKGMIKLRVQNLKEHYNLDTEYSIKDGGTLFVTAGPFAKEVLVLAITPKVQ
jgi:hypothetical protein